MATWLIELVTNGNICTRLEIEAVRVDKLDYHNLLIDGVTWQAPEALDMSFAKVEKMDS